MRCRGRVFSDSHQIAAKTRQSLDSNKGLQQQKHFVQQTWHACDCASFSEVPLGSETSGGSESGRPELQMQALGPLLLREASDSLLTEKWMDESWRRITHPW